MEEIIEKMLEKVRSKDEKAFYEFTKAFKEESCKKGTDIFSIGRVCKRIYILKSGLAKHYRIKDDGNESITWFGFSGEIITAYTSFVTQKPSDEGIFALEDCELISMSRDKCYELAQKYHAVETFFRELLELYFMDMEERLYFLQAYSAKQKYEHILKHKPEFLQLVPQKELASFLGITRETLSRIRKIK